MSASSPYTALTTRLEDIDSLDHLGLQWRLLQSKASPCFFLSWCWVYTWLKTLQPKAPHVRFGIIKTYDGESLVGLGVVSFSKRYYLRLLPSNVLRFHQTGDGLLDQIWPEYNGLLVQKGCEDAVYESVLNYLGRDNSWDEIIAGVITQDVDKRLTKSGLACEVVSHSYSYCVDLAGIRVESGDYLSTLSRNTRHQIRRSLKCYSAIAPLRLEFANSINQAYDFFDKISPLHRNRWGEGSGFNNSSFVCFHKALIEQGFDDGQVELVRVLVGDKPLGYLYNFMMEGRLYFYLSGIDYSDPQLQDKHMKPGLVMHALRIQYCLDEQPELSVYDFMAGDSRYKQSLASKTDDMLVAHYRRPRACFTLLSQAKRLKHTLAPVIEKLVKSRE